ASYRKALAGADTVIACSKRNAADMAAVLHRTIDTIPCFSRAVAAPTGAKPAPGAKLRFGYFGRLIPEKGIDLLCRLSEDPACGAIAFHIWGEGPAYLASFFERYPNVHFHGAFRGKEALSKIVAELDAFLLLSVHPEGLPISLLECMSGGLPWIATDRGGIPDIACEPLSTRVLAADVDVEAAKTAVLALADDLRAGRVTRDRQQALYRSRFAPDVLVREWSQVLQLN
ncbi:MAG: glycosyltransferase family 4 protein, partial [Catalinimonas sp.]